MERSCRLADTPWAINRAQRNPKRRTAPTVVTPIAASSVVEKRYRSRRITKATNGK
jgi:hypothetical protein